jgi:glycogenin glucosyltransferase
MASPYAFVTLVSSDSYLPGALALVAALKDLHNSPPVEPEVDFQTLCLVTPESVDVSTIKLLRKAFDVVIGVEILEHENIKGLKLLGEHSILSLFHRLLLEGTHDQFGVHVHRRLFLAYLVHLPPQSVAN